MANLFSFGEGSGIEPTSSNYSNQTTTTALTNPADLGSSQSSNLNEAPKAVSNLDDAPVVNAANVPAEDVVEPTVVTSENAKEQIKQDAEELDDLTTPDEQAPEPPQDDTEDLLKELDDRELSPAEKALQEHSEFLNTRADQINSEFEQQKQLSDEDLKVEIANIQEIYRKRVKQMELFNKNQLGGKALRGARTGRQRYAADLQMDIMSEEESAGMSRITDLNNMMRQEIAAVKSAYKNNDLAMMREKSASIADLMAQKRQAILDQANLAAQEEDRMMKKLEFSQQQKQYQQQQVDKMAGNLSNSMVEIDEAGNITMPTSEEIQSMADSYGIDANVLISNIKNTAREMKNMDIEDKKSYLEMAKLQNEVAGYGMSAVQQEYEYAVQNYGYSGSQFDFIQDKSMSEENPYDIIKKQLEIDKLTRESTAGGDWKKVIINGVDYIKYDDGRTVKASDAFPGEVDYEAISSATDKINEIGNLLLHKGMTQAVGASPLSRGAKQALIPGSGVSPLEVAMGSKEKKQFIGKVERLIDEETLTTLTDLKAKGGTLGALSDQERIMLRNAASTIGGWAVDKNGDGKPEYYDIDEDAFKEELGRLQSLATKALKKASGVKYLSFDEMAQEVSEDEIMDKMNNPDFGNTIEEKRNTILQWYNQGESGFNNVGGDTNSATLGSLSEQYESGGDPGAIGYDRTGGYSYGAYQLAHTNAQKFVQQSHFARFFGGKKFNSNEFRQTWKQLAQQKPQEFKQAQKDFIAKTHYNPQVKKLTSAGMPLSRYSNVLKDVIWSTAVQHGANTNVITTAYGRLARGGRKPSERDLINEIYKERWAGGRRFTSSTSQVKSSVRNRFENERRQALSKLS